MLDVSVIVPARNAENLLDGCLASIVASNPRELIVVDGMSTDRTVDIARSHGATVLSDEGRGLPAARLAGAKAASSPRVALIDADVVLGKGDLERLLDEHARRRYTALQAGLRSVSGPGYWGRALVHHHRTGLSKSWFGVSATIFDREALLQHGFDPRFLSGEDIDLRWRLRRSGARIGVSRRTVVEHRFGDSWKFAKGQWLADGHGLARMVTTHGPKGTLLLGLPLAAGVRGTLLSLARRQPRWIPYYLCFVLFNYAGLFAELAARLTSRGPRASPTEGQALAPLSQVSNGLALIASKAITMGLGFAFWVLAARLFAPRQVGIAAGVVSAMMLCTQLAQFGFGSAFITHFPRLKRRPARLLDTSFTLVALLAAGCGVLFVVIASFAFHALNVVAGSAGFALLFVAATVFGTLGILFDQVATSLRRGEQALARNVAFGVGTLALLPVMARLTGTHSAQSVFFPWAAAGLGACAMGIRQLRRALPAYRPRLSVDRPLSHELVRAGLPNYVLTLAERTPGLILPVIVAEVLSPSANATWYAIWMMAWVIYIVPIQVGMTIFAEVSHDPGAVRESVRRGILCSLGVGAAGAVVLGLGAHKILAVLGHHYAQGGAGPLRVLLLAFVPLTFVQAYFSSCRARRRLGEAIRVGWANAVASVALAAAAGVTRGLMGMAVAWVAVQFVTGAWSLWRLRVITALPGEGKRRRRSVQADPGFGSARP